MSPTETYFLKIGDVQVSNSPKIFKTILGSCVSVCIWDIKSCHGGMNHFLLPLAPADEQTPKYGDYSIRKLISQIKSTVSPQTPLIAKIFGGGNIVSVIRDAIGDRNVMMAKQILAENNIEIVAEDTGGTRSRFINFDTSNGKILVKYK
jgi:chemotaxis protein CheD